MNHPHSTTSFILSLALTFSAVLGQESKSRSNERLAWFIQTDIPEGLENPVSVRTGKEIEEVTLSNRLASGPVKIPADGIIRLVRRAADPADATKSVDIILAEAKVPEGSNQALVILVPSAPDPSSSLLFRTKVQPLSNFKGGDSLYLNLTNLNVAVELGDQKIPLKPGTIQVLQGKLGAGATDVPFRYSYYHPVQEKWKVLSASVTIATPTRREIIIFSVDSQMNHVRCSNITFPVAL